MRVASPFIGDPIASGRTADIYPWGEGTVLKLFHARVPMASVEKERHNALAARSTGIATPDVGEIVQTDGRFGLVFERVDGPTLFEKVQAEPESVERLARRLAEWHADMHRLPLAARLPSQRQRLVEKVSGCGALSLPERTAVLDRIARLPDDHRLCHGDFHPGNVIMSADGPSIIDWVDAGRGNPVADVARTSILLLGHIENSTIDEMEKSAAQLFHQTYLQHYMATMPERWPEYEQWLLVAAAARLTEGIEDQQDWLLARVQMGLRA